MKDVLEVKRFLIYIRMIDQSLRQQLENGQKICNVKYSDSRILNTYNYLLKLRSKE
jgi:hypothetical protein